MRQTLQGDAGPGFPWTLYAVDSVERAVILYDADCGFCRWSLARILGWDRRSRLRPVPLQSAEADLLLGPMAAEAKFASWHLVSPDGAVRSAGDAVAPVLRLLPGGGPIAAVASTFPKTTDRAYRWVSGHRELMANLVGEQACSVDPATRYPTHRR
jgi:predicted DCC family thiol-disulfide oxidoreductase YuxK